MTETILYSVIKTKSGFCREDPSEPDIVGIYSDLSIANKVKLVVSGDAKVIPITLNFIPHGIIQSAVHFGIDLKN